jgi:transposase InsO family protein
LRSDNGGDFNSKEFMDYCSSHGIKMQFSIARTPQHNGVVERKNRTVQEMAKTMLMDSKLPAIFLDRGSAYNSSHSKQSNAQKKHSRKSLRAMERKMRKCKALQSFWKQMLHQKRRW